MSKTTRSFLYLTLFWIALFGLLPFVFSLDPIEQTHGVFQPFFTISGLGSDDVGRDLMARILFGGRIALALGIVSVLGSILIGVPIGVFSAWKKSWIDEAIQRITDLGLGFPSILLGVIIVTITGPGFIGLCLIILIINIPQIIRLVRNLTLSELNKDYIQGAYAIGLGNFRILRLYLLPSMTQSLIIVSTTLLGTAVLEAAGLSFLGLGIMPPDPDWGAMVAEYRKYILAAPHLFLLPSVAIVLFSGSYILLSEALRKHQTNDK